MEIDVKQCKHYKNENCIADYLLTDMTFSQAKCELNTDCYFKQLQQLKQQNEILSEAVEYHNLVKCPKCGYYSLPQYVCHKCGYEL